MFNITVPPTALPVKWGKYIHDPGGGPIHRNDAGEDLNRLKGSVTLRSTGFHKLVVKEVKHRGFCVNREVIESENDDRIIFSGFLQYIRSDDDCGG